MSTEIDQPVDKQRKPHSEEQKQAQESAADYPQQVPRSDQQHIPEQSTVQGKNMDKLLNRVPNMAPAGALGTETKGPLSAVGDPLGQILNYGLKPLGHVTGAIGNPNGEALLKVRRVAEHEGIAEGEPKYLPHQDNGKPDEELPGGVRIGGKKQDGENPLGL